MKSTPRLAMASTALVLTGCARKTVVLEGPPLSLVADPVAKTKTGEMARLGEAIDSFERNSSAENSEEVKKAFAKLDEEIAELEEYIAKHIGDQRAEAAAKLKNRQSYRAAETARFTEARMKAPLSGSAQADARTGAEKLENSVRKAGDAVEDAARRTGDAIKDVVR